MHGLEVQLCVSIIVCIQIRQTMENGELDDNLKMYTLKEIAAILKVSKTQIHTLEKQKLLVPIDWSDSLNKNPRRKKRFIRYSHDSVMILLKGKNK
jgi:hypothetical protein